VAIRLNHTIVAAHDKETSATFLTTMLGLPTPSLLGPFAVVRVGDDTSLDYMDTEDEIATQHYAFLVDEVEFDEIFARIRERGLPYWADPYRRERDQINPWDGGRGVYFDDPNGHLLEIITRPYGSGGTTASRPHPLIAPTLDPADHEDRGYSHQGKVGRQAATTSDPIREMSSKQKERREHR
jgi:catechol 2,3-dioxygenase-like lactoylglutathione lyase family enzyme